MAYQAVFKRYELKYLLTPEQKEHVLRAMEPHMQLDKYGDSIIRNLYYDTGTGKVEIAATEQAKLIPGNIRQGINILGVEGSMSSTEGANPQAKSVTPTESEQVVLPDEGYNYLSQVTIGAIPSTHIKTADATATAADIKQGATAYVNGKKLVGTHTDPSFSLSNNVLTIM